MSDGWLFLFVMVLFVVPFIILSIIDLETTEEKREREFEESAKDRYFDLVRLRFTKTTIDRGKDLLFKEYVPRDGANECLSFIEHINSFIEHYNNLHEKIYPNDERFTPLSPLPTAIEDCQTP